MKAITNPPLDLYLPSPTSSKIPLFVFIHGGAWVSRDKADYAYLGKFFASQNVATAVINYRLSTDLGPRYPCHVDDSAAAVEWVFKNATSYGIDKKKIFVGGHSAGAHISGMLAAREPLASQIAGFIGLEGIYDIPKLVKLRPEYIAEFIQQAFGSDSHTWGEASPSTQTFQVKTPWLVIHSEQDELVELEQSTEFVEHLKSQKVPVTSLTVKGQKHFAVIEGVAQPDSQVGQKILGFIYTIVEMGRARAKNPGPIPNLISTQQ